MNLFEKCVSFIALAIALTTASAQTQKTVSLQKYKDPAQQVAWIAYGSALGKYTEDHKIADSLPVGPWEPTFDAEVYARETQVVVWKELLQKMKLNYPFMSQMVEISDSGYMKEYVWTYYKKTSWEQPAGLRIPEFSAWAQQHLQGHKSQTGAQIIISAK